MADRFNPLSPRHVLAVGSMPWLVLSCSVAAALSQELPREGTFSITYTTVIPSPAKPIPLGKDRDYHLRHAILTTVNDAGSGFLHNLSGRCGNAFTIDSAAKTIEVYGACHYTDRGGDQIYADYSTAGPQPLGPPFLALKAKWNGGTGKYAGLSGEFEIRHNAVLTSDALAQGAGKYIGSYKLTSGVTAAN